MRMNPLQCTRNKEENLTINNAESTYLDTLSDYKSCSGYVHEIPLSPMAGGGSRNRSQSEVRLEQRLQISVA